jgi:threonine dehydratase
MSDFISLAEIQNARQRIAPCIRRTPLTASASLSERLRTNVYVKLELFQKTGSFKVRGAFSKALNLRPEERRHFLKSPNMKARGGPSFILSTIRW